MHRPYPDSREPIYIGFERPTNGLGIAGFVVSLTGLLVTFGLICPIGIALSFFGLFKKPRGLAVAGFLIGIAGTALPLFTGYSLVRSHEVRESRMQAEAKTDAALEKAQDEVERFRQQNDHVPEGIEGNKIVVRQKDGWGRELRYDLHPRDRMYIVRSAGPDGKFETQDDVIRPSIVPSREIRDSQYDQ